MKRIILILSLIFVCIVGFGCQKEEKEVVKEQQKPELYKTLMQGTEFETQVYVIDSGVEGPTIFINGGTHGSEPAGFNAAERLLDTQIKKGKLYIIPRANRAACKIGKRMAENMIDLNRQFPGKSDGNEVEKLAYEIAQTIKDINPEMVMDLHESLGNYREGRLGNSIIFTPIKELPMLVLDLVEAVNARTDEGEDFTFITNAPKGSLNTEIATNFDIQVLTIETNRQIDLEKRIEEQLIIADEVLKMFELK